jgi:hypothetical protein
MTNTASDTERSASVAAQWPAVAPAEAGSAKGTTKTKAAPSRRKPAKATKKKATAKVGAPKKATTTKAAQPVALISRKGGASLPELMKALGWQKHSVRGASSTLKNTGLKIQSVKRNGVRTYSAKCGSANCFTCRRVQISAARPAIPFIYQRLT